MIQVRGVSKAYRIWRSPAARLCSIVLHGVKRVLPALTKRCAAAQQRLYRDFYALKDVDVEIGRGEAVGIIGRNGSGKSTLLQIIAGTLAPNTGTVEVTGKVAALLELGSGFNFNFTGRENVYLNASIMGLSEGEIRGRFDEIEAFADIGEFIDQPVRTYSSGMVLRLAFAVQIAVEPEILIIDEALAVGDEAFQRKCLSRLELLRSGGTTLLFVSHGMQTVVDLCHRCVLLDKGGKVEDGLPKDVVITYQRMLYGKREGDIPAARSAAAIPGPPTTARYSPDFYDPALRSNPVIYVPAGAVITQVRVENEEGEIVNRLLTGRSYCIAYEVEFQANAARVDVGTMIKTVTGTEVAGATTLDSPHCIPEVMKGDRMTVRYRFHCNLLPAVYFVRAGVGSIDASGQLYFLHRIEDALMIRVGQAAPQLARGLADCRFQLSIEPGPEAAAPALRAASTA